ncbi:MAG: DUF4430 domain-containing protein [Actinobacteria bacterium]|nr:DUF4430 domain-containing protein [Actinomycetota bacterium]
MRSGIVTVCLALVLAACGGGGESGEAGRADAGGHGPTAQLWVTHDRGEKVVVDATVPAGLNAIQALEQHADVETRYGGRFVQAIEGVEGGLERRQDWFYFLNGIEADLGGAEVTVRAGDVVWWDFRSWRDELRQPVVVGAFPEPFLHGWDGKRRPAEVRGPPELEEQAGALLEFLGGPRGQGEPNLFELRIEPGAEGATLTARRGARNDSPVVFTLAGSMAALEATAEAVTTSPELLRFHYEASFDDEGRIRE